MKTIRQQLTRKLSLGFALLLGLGGAGVYISTRAALVKEFDDTLRAKAMAITTLTTRKGEVVTVDFSDRFMRGFGGRIATDFFQMWDTNGVSLERSESLGKAGLPCRFGSFKQPEFWDFARPAGPAGRAVGFTFAPPKPGNGEGGPAAAGKIILVVASDRRELDRTLATLALVLAASGLLLLTATALVVPRVLRRELAPLAQLAEQADGITADSLATRFATATLPGELRPIGRRLNDLLARLEQSFERERRFSADLAHELRTPIAELRSLAELALKWPDAREAQTDREVLAVALQMEGVVTRLLALLRSERGLLPVTREPVALAPLLESLGPALAAKAAAKQLDYSCRIPAGAVIETDPVVFRCILANLLDNAVEYTPRGGAVRVDCAVDKEAFTLRVANTAEPLAPEDVARLFDRFWRKDPARSGTDHSGLGLSLSRAFARALGCGLTAAPAGESQLVLTLSRPPGPAKASTSPAAR